LWGPMVTLRFATADFTGTPILRGPIDNAGEKWMRHNFPVKEPAASDKRVTRLDGIYVHHLKICAVPAGRVDTANS
jgi:hypothetical protein